MLEVKNISKEFPGVKALDNVSIRFESGHIHALLGENGAGKSTLMKIISGIYTADSGEVLMDGKKVSFRHLSDALQNGLAVVNQEIQVIPEASVTENVMLDKLERYKKNGLINWKALTADAHKCLETVGLDIDPNMQAGGLSAAKKQLIQIARAIAFNAKILMLDEPTSSITMKEIEKLFILLRQLRDQGVVIIFVSHKLDEVLEICDSMSVLRDGKLIGSCSCDGITKQDIVRMMIGREMKDRYLGTLDVDYKDVVLKVENICQKKHKFENISFELYRGEILGFYGLVGSGRTELAKIIIGDDHADSGRILCNGKESMAQCVADSLEKNKLGYVSENRKEEGLILSDSILMNIGVTYWKQIRNSVTKAIDIQEELKRCDTTMHKLAVKAPSRETIVDYLSGGNQQKVSIGKWLAAGCDILIIDEPTVGVDVGAKEHIYDIIWDLAKNQGKSIILISSDMPELIMLSRRILVFKDSKIAGEIAGLNNGEFSTSYVANQIGQYFA